MAALVPPNLDAAPIVEPPNPTNVAPIPVKRLTNLERKEIVQTILRTSDAEGSKKRNIINELAEKYGKTRQTISRIWNMAKKQIEKSEVINVNRRYEGRTGPKKKEFNLSRLAGIPLEQRTTIRSLAVALKISRSTIQRLVQSGAIRCHSSAIKPFLTPECKKKRLEFCLSKLHFDQNNENPAFEDCYNYVHIDEKWFYMTKADQKFYLHPLEIEPHRTCKNKKYITKVMFLAAVARPRFGEGGEVLFDGKLGIFPFTFMAPAKRKSKNRPAGTMETKAIDSITKEVIKDCLINNVLPSIKSKWPDQNGGTIFVQQDNARPHISTTDHEFTLAANEGGWDILMCNQPPSSPDLNVLDLGFFRAIQSLQHEKAPNGVLELVEAVKEAYNELDSYTLNKVWLSYQACMNEVMTHKGNNNYKLPHMSKDSLQRQGLLPDVFKPNIEDVNEARNFLEVGDFTVTQTSQPNMAEQQTEQEATEAAAQEEAEAAAQEEAEVAAHEEAEAAAQEEADWQALLDEIDNQFNDAEEHEVFLHP